MIQLLRMLTIVFVATACMVIPLQVGAWELGSVGTDGEGWVLDDTGEKHFAIGLWGIPAYTFSRTGAEPAANDSIYLAQTAPFNTIVMQAGYQKDYMRERETTFMAGVSSFRWHFSQKGYSGGVPLAPEYETTVGSNIGFARMQSIRDHIDDLRLYLSETIYPFITDGYRGERFIHFIMDEPDTGGGDWFWPPEVISVYNDIIHEREPEGLTFIDFGGTISGNRLFYARMFGEVFLTGTDPDRGECNPERMNTYCYASDGSPLYRYEKTLFLPGQWVRRPPADFAHLFYENVFHTARAYQGTSDIVGFNTYLPYRDFPESAGETVDALKDALGNETPVWLFFDGYGGAKPLGMSWESYARLVTCQVYTSIIHGATGALFFSDRADGAYWPLVRDLARKLGDDRMVFALPVRTESWDNAYHTGGYSHIHYSIRSDSDTSWLIVTNTDAGSSHTVDVPGFGQFELESLGVRIIRAGN